MKKMIIIVALFAIAHGCKAEEVILTASNCPEIKLTPQYPKAPICPMTLDFTDHTLTFPYAFCEMVTVELLDDDENVAYTDYLFAGQTSLTFPSTLSGEYTLRLTVGNYYYIGLLAL